MTHINYTHRLIRCADEDSVAVGRLPVGQPFYHACPS
jgi:hypothetical protein